MTKIILVRHGHVEGITPPRFRGRVDLPLDARGVDEARAVAQRIAAEWMPSVVYSSPLSRCVATGEPIAEACRIEVHILQYLIDMDFGAWQFKSFEEMQEAYPALFAAWFETPHLFRFPGGDSLQDVVARSAEALRFVLERHANDTVVMVSHDNVNRALLLQLLDQPLSAYWRFAQTPCCINEIDIVSGEVRLIRLNETEHLRELAAKS
jgi:broad specificity phosphatase PhoE